MPYYYISYYYPMVYLDYIIIGGGGGGGGGWHCPFFPCPFSVLSKKETRFRDKKGTKKDKEDSKDKLGQK